MEKNLPEVRALVNVSYRRVNYGMGLCLASIENIYDDYWIKNWLVLSHFLILLCAWLLFK